MKRWLKLPLVGCLAALAPFAAPAQAAPGLDLLARPALASGEIRPPEEVFRPLIVRATSRTLVIEWNIEPGHYLYRDTLGITLPGESGLSPGVPDFSPAERIMDPYFGPAFIFRDRAVVSLPLLGEVPAALEVVITLQYQGCIEGRLCYPPSEQRLPVLFEATP